MELTELQKNILLDIAGYYSSVHYVPRVRDMAIEKLKKQGLITNDLNLTDFGTSVLYKIMIERLEVGDNKDKAVAIALRYGPIEGDHHKMWVIDQMLQLLLGDKYNSVIGVVNLDPDCDNWDTGIAP